MTAPRPAPGPKLAMEPPSTPENADERCIEVILSRPVYRLGGTVVGTLLLTPPEKSAETPRSWIKSVHAYVAGRCRIDPRWLNADTYKNIYGIHPNLEGKYEGEWDEVDAKAVESQLGPNSEGTTTVCFWATNVMDMMDLQERTVGKWKDVNARDRVAKFLPSIQKQGEETIVAVAPPKRPEDQAALESRHVAFTFRADLPPDLPHSANANCCRYFYSVVVCLRTVNKEVIIVNTPFTVWTSLDKFLPQPTELLGSAARIRLGNISAMAHSTGLPTYLSATELHRPRGQMTVNRHVGLGSVAGRGDIKSLRVSNPKGEPCVLLTIMGSSLLNPGSRMLLQFDFPKGWVPCCQVSACLEGEEMAIYEDGSLHRTRSYQFDTAHELIQADCTDRVSLTLLLPLDCPCTLHTDLVKISVECRIDITVEQPDGNYMNLRLNLPCFVAHGATAEVDDEVDTLASLAPLDELIFGDEASTLVDDDYRSPSSFRTKDIQKELSALSLRMAEKFNLT